jgi:hypothetical protein
LSAAVDEDLIRLVAKEAATPCAAEVHALARAARARHGNAVVAVLFYGSGLRDGSIAGKLADLYVVVESYEAMDGSRLLRWLNRVLPPNVYYLRLPGDGPRIHAKYAVASLPQLERLVSPATENPYFWARFAQPTAIVWARDAAVRDRLVRMLALAARTMVLAARPLAPLRASPRELWTTAFGLTYQTELRAEPASRGGQIYAADSARYDQIARAVRPRAASEQDAATAARRWRRRRLQGKLLSVLRLVKGAFTFEDGADYLAWKMERHSGVKVSLTPFQRRHPVLTSPVLFWRLYRAGAFR